MTMPKLVISRGGYKFPNTPIGQITLTRRDAMGQFAIRSDPGRNVLAKYSCTVFKRSRMMHE